MKKKLLAGMLSAVMVMGVLAGCGGAKEEASTTAPTTSTETTEAQPTVQPSAEQQAASEEAKKVGGTFKSVESFMYGSLDPHVDYYAWHSQKYGMTETLYRINDEMSVVPWLAEGLVQDGPKVTVTLKDGLTFSNGDAVVAQDWVDTWMRLKEKNKRFAYLGNWTFECPDDKTIVITTGDKVYPTITNDLAEPAMCVLDLEATTDMDNNPICTGPFVVETFVSGGDLTTVKNENYWGGEVNLDGAVWYAMSNNEAKLMAMQNGELDGYMDLTAADIEVLSLEPDKYILTSTGSQARNFALVNSNNVPDAVREAIAYAIDREIICAYAPGVLSPSYGHYSTAAAYGKVTMPTHDLAKAEEIMTAAGYTKENGLWVKDGANVELEIACYAARQIDTVALVMQEQLNAFGFVVSVRTVDDPDGTYMTVDDFDIGLYRSTTDKSGDPWPFIEGAIMSGSYQDRCGFGNAETDAKIEALRYEADLVVRAEKANEIMTDFYASFTNIPIAVYNRNIVLAYGSSGYGETNPYEFYGIGKDTTTGLH